MPEAQRLSEADASDERPPGLTRRLLLLALIAFGLRLAFLALEPRTPPAGDERTWIGWGIRSPAGVASPEVRFDPLATGVLFYPPAYPYFIGAVYALFGTLTAVRIVQAAVGSLLVPALGLIAARAAESGGPETARRAGSMAGAIAAFYPELVWFSVHFWSETLFMLLLWWALERLWTADARACSRTALCAGLLWGASILTRETALYFTPLAAAWLCWRARPGAPRRAAAFLLAALLAVAPWTWRNWVKHGAFIPVSTAGGLNLWQGNAPLTRQEVYDRYQAVQGLAEQYRHAQRMGLQAIVDRQPWWLFEKLRAEMPLFWEADSLALVHVVRGAYGDVPLSALLAAAVVVLAPYLALLMLCVAGLARLRLGRRLALLLAFLAYYNLLHVVTHGFARYRLPVMPVLFVVAALVLGGRASLETPSRRRLVAAALALALALSVAPSLLGWLDLATGAGVGSGSESGELTGG